MKFVLARVENIVGIEENAGYSNFSFSLNFSKSFFFSGSLNSLPTDKILDQPKLEAFADDKIKLTEKLKFVQGMIENIVGKGEYAGKQHFFSFSQNVFKRLILRVVISRDCVAKS